MENYNVSIAKASKELSKVERVKFKDTNDCAKLDELTKQGEVIIDVDFYVLIDVHNEAAKGDKDYQQIVIVDHEGNKYCTGSKTFVNTSSMLSYCWAMLIFSKMTMQAKSSLVALLLNL